MTDQPEVQITVLGEEENKDNPQWVRNAQIMLKLYSNAPALYDMMYTLAQCYAHDWKPRHQEQVQKLLENAHDD